MNGMKGLIYRELYLARKSILSVVGVFFVLMIMGLLIQLSFSSGNLAKLPAEEMGDIRGSIYYLFIIVPAACLFVPLGAVTEVLMRDYASRWMPFQYSTPVKPEKYVFVKTAIVTAILLGGFVLSALGAVVVSASSGRALTYENFSFIPWIMALAAFTFTLATLVTALLRNVKIAIFAFVLPFYYIFMILNIDLIDGIVEMDTAEQMLELAAKQCASTAPIAYIITIVSVILFQVILTSIYKKRKERKPPKEKKKAQKGAEG